LAPKLPENVAMALPKLLALSIVLLALLFAAGLLAFVYFQGGVSHAIRTSMVLNSSYEKHI
jgi:hypothetical protein